MFDIAVHAFQNSPPRLEPPKEGAFYGALLLLMGPIEVFKIIPSLKLGASESVMSKFLKNCYQFQWK